MNPVPNIGHSVFQRLLNRAKKNKEDFNLLLVRFGVERFLYRLSISKHAQRFILKGANLLFVWKGQNYRVTKDIDLAGIGEADTNIIRHVFQEICQISSPLDDGIRFIADTVQVEEIREETPYGGMRVKLTGYLHNARIHLQVDIGFGDLVKPDPEIVHYPTLLDMPAPVLKAYQKYTFIAEKFEAMVQLGIANSRMKDFFDVWLLPQLLEFNGKVLADTIVTTFERRKTKIPVEEFPFVFTKDFREDSQQQVQWKAFIRNAKPAPIMEDFSELIGEIADFIMPVLEQIKNPGLDLFRWQPGKGWIQKRVKNEE